MATFFSRREGAAGTRRVIAAPRTGLLFLNTQKRRLYCLNEVARQLVAEGIPVTAGDLERQPLRTLDGEAVTGDDLPLVGAWRENASRSFV
jgi:hypothetical protein